MGIVEWLDDYAIGCFPFEGCRLSDVPDVQPDTLDGLRYLIVEAIVVVVFRRIGEESSTIVRITFTDSLSAQLSHSRMPLTRLSPFSVKIALPVLAYIRA